jgi:hypothetical protein
MKLIFLLLFFSANLFAVETIDCPEGKEPALAIVTVNGSTTEQVVCVDIIVPTVIEYDTLTGYLYLQGITVKKGLTTTGQQYYSATMQYDSTTGQFDLIEYIP